MLAATKWEKMEKYWNDGRKTLKINIYSNIDSKPH